MQGDAAAGVTTEADRFGALVRPCDLGKGTLRVAIKDCIDIAGWQTRQGSAVLADVPPAIANAEVVTCILSDPRWRIIGKARMHEFAYGVSGLNPACGTPINPFWPDRVPGGSSSGSAVAVASGLADVAIGTDTGGSVRMPAACCGVIGFKPTFGLVSRRGAHPAKSSLDCIGIFAREMGLVEAMMETIAPGFVPATLSRSPTLGLVTPGTSNGIAGYLAAAIAGAGIAHRSTALDGMEAAFAAGMTIIGRETWAALAPFVSHPGMGDDVRTRLMRASALTDEDLGAAEDVRAAFRDGVDAALEGVDALVLPTLPVVPPLLSEAEDAAALLPLTRLVRPFNLSGHPAIALPLRAAHGVPVSLQLVGRHGGDAALCAVAAYVIQRLGAAGLYGNPGTDREN